MGVNLPCPSFFFFFLTFSILFCISVFVLPGIYPYIYVKTFLYFKFLGSFLLGPLEKERGYPVFILRKQDLQLSLRYCFVVVIFFFKFSSISLFPVRYFSLLLSSLTPCVHV